MQKHGDVSHMSNRRMMLLIHDSCLVQEPKTESSSDNSDSQALVTI